MVELISRQSLIDKCDEYCRHICSDHYANCTSTNCCYLYSFKRLVEEADTLAIIDDENKLRLNEKTT